MPTLETSRSELHALVWSKPTRDCAEQLGISDTGLAKLCRRNDVMLPPRGYWLRKHQRQVPPPLKGKDREITAYLPRRPSAPAEVEVHIPVLPVGGRLHKELVRVRSALKSAMLDKYGRLRSQRTDVKVSKQTLPRALDLLNIIVRTALKLDFKVGSSGNCIQLFRGDVAMSLNIIEPSKQSLGEVTKIGRFEFVDRDYTPGGQLRLSLPGLYGEGIQYEWTDKPDKPLESQIEDIMRAILRGFEILEIRKKAHREQQRRYAVQRVRNERKTRAKELLGKRQQSVDKLIDEWQRSKHITQVMDELEAQDEKLSPKNRRLIRWARDLARHYDPLDSFTIDGLDD